MNKFAYKWESCYFHTHTVQIYNTYKHKHAKLGPIHVCILACMKALDEEINTLTLACNSVQKHTS